MNEELTDIQSQSPDDGRTALAFAIGLAAAVAAGGLWALLVIATNMEIGYAAWGVGGLVGFAMSRVTVQRTSNLAYGAAALAIIGLVCGKAFIFASSTNDIAAEFNASDEWLGSAVAWQMYAERSLDAAILTELDAAEERGDTLSNELWTRMQEQAALRIAGMTPEERESVSRAAAETVVASMGLVGGIRAQLSAFDLLWILLAVGTAYRMLAPPKLEPVPHDEDAGDPVP